MRIGVCASIDKLPLLKELGYDYIELHFGRLAALDETEYHKQTREMERFSIAAEAFNCFFEKDMVLYAPNGDQDPLLRQIRTYAERGLARAAAWGCKVAVIGSGGARKRPEEMSLEEANWQFSRVLAVCGEVADNYGIKIAVEPLSYVDCNYIHTLAEGSAVAKLSDCPAVGMTVDFFHQRNNGDDLSTLPNYADILYHSHYAHQVDRFAPTADDKPDLELISALLKECPKIDRISLECCWSPDFESAVTNARPLMEVFKRS